MTPETLDAFKLKVREKFAALQLIQIPTNEVALFSKTFGDTILQPILLKDGRYVLPKISGLSALAAKLTAPERAALAAKVQLTNFKPEDLGKPKIVLSTEEIPK